MSHQVLARKWRPKLFSEVIGQPHIVTALTNAITQNRLHQAYLFTGTRGVGKTTLARILAKCLNCEQGPTATPCGKCPACCDIDQGRFLDLIEIDAASRTKVEDTRELLESAQYPAVRGRSKIYLIDEVHMLSTHSFNALLKTLEEPPAHLTFLLATTDPQKLPITVLSRCLQFTLKSVPVPLLTEHLQHILTAETIQFESDALQALAQAGQGSVRDTLSLTDQAIALTNGYLEKAAIEDMLGSVDRDLIAGLVDALLAHSAHQTLAHIDRLAQSGADFIEISKAFISTLHKIALSQWITDTTSADNTKLATWAAQFSKENIQLYYQLALLAHRDLLLCPNSREGFEMLMLRLLTLDGHASTLPMSIAPSTTESPDVAPIASVTRSSASAPIASPTPKVKSTDPQQLEPPLTDDRTVETIPTPSTPAQSQQAKPQSSESELPIKSDKQNTTLDWEQATSALSLTGSALNLAKNCSLISYAPPELLLNLTPDREALKTRTSEAQLLEALRVYLGEAIHIKIQVGHSDTVSPQQTIEAKAQKALQLAEQAIAADPMIQGLKSKMGAMIKPNSISPTDNISNDPSHA